MDENKIQEFMAAVHNGSTVFAHPDTAELLRPIIENIESCKFVAEGELFAIDLSRYSIPVGELLRSNVNFDFREVGHVSPLRDDV